jgi:hypothetical protein
MGARLTLRRRAFPSVFDQCHERVVVRYERAEWVE